MASSSRARGEPGSFGSVHTARRNGTSTDVPASLDDIQMFPGFHLLSLEDA